MFYLYTLLFSLLVQFHTATDLPYSSLEAAFKSGDAGKIMSYGKDKLIINVLEKEGVYAQAQASQVVKDFFTKKPCSSFIFTFKSAASDDGATAIGSYNSKGEIFRITLKWKKISGDYKLESLVIERS